MITNESSHHINCVSPLLNRIVKIKDGLYTLLGGQSEVINCFNAFHVKGNICSSEVYDILRTRNHNKPWMRWIWKHYIPPKYSFILWLGTWLLVRKFGCWCFGQIGRTLLLAWFLYSCNTCCMKL
ncbi:unnamed protein product [Cuscuta epithymum]|uniref:Reverse transcriptase zinc-binding domain-containing protein n=1 Tax=Cuscuta epithymum TaxID=186058 RepID=A0AAV0E393_9ASTE|nr:unnamed protein product [Cuscuta epithymum]